MNNLVIIQARMGSTRLPNKVLKDLAGKPALWHVIDRVGRSKNVSEVVVATSYKKENLEIVRFCADLGIRVFAGSEDDVLDRYYQVAKLFKPDNIIRITADCPLHDSKIIDAVIEKHIKEDNDYTSNVLEETFPDGLDCEVIKYEVLKEAWKEAKLVSEREHVTQYIIKNEKYKKGNLKNSQDKSAERWTLDTDEDYEFIKTVYNELYKEDRYFDAEEIYKLLEDRSEIREINKNLIRNEGLIKSLKEDKEYEMEDNL